MKLLLDFFPILLFFITFKLHDDPQQGVLAATAVIIAATGVQVGITWVAKRRVEKMHLVTLALVVVFGGTTLLLNDETYIKWKPSVVNWLFGFAFLGSHLVGGRNLTERVMGASLRLPAPIWTRLNLAWVGFFLAMGLLNLYVVYAFDTETWVNFKLFGLMGLTLLFLLGQALYLARYLRDDRSGE